MAWPMKPQAVPARLYSANFTPTHETRLSGVYGRCPGGEGAKTALGTRAKVLCKPGSRYMCRLFSILLH